MSVNPKNYEPLTFEEFEALFQPLAERPDDLTMFPTSDYDANALLTLDEPSLNHLEHLNAP